MEKRGIVLAVILTICTFGLYSLYWEYKLTNEIHMALGRRNTASGGWVLLYTIVTCGIYGFYWAYKMGEAIEEISEKSDIRGGKNMALICLVLSVLGLMIVGVCILQDKLNDFIEKKKEMEYNEPGGLLS